MKRVFIALIGGTVLLLGIALQVLPWPGLPIIAAALAILATEIFRATHARDSAGRRVQRIPIELRGQ